jgi:hypothetical protein
VFFRTTLSNASPNLRCSQVGANAHFQQLFSTAYRMFAENFTLGFAYSVQILIFDSR